MKRIIYRTLMSEIQEYTGADNLVLPLLQIQATCNKHRTEVNIALRNRFGSKQTRLEGSNRLSGDLAYRVMTCQ